MSSQNASAPQERATAAVPAPTSPALQSSASNSPVNSPKTLGAYSPSLQSTARALWGERVVPVAKR